MKEMRKPWKQSLIIKLVGKRVGYQVLLQRIHVMWQPKHHFSLIDSPNEFFIIKFSSRDDYDVALYNGPWMIKDHYLHVQRRRPNFMVEDGQIKALPIWVRFPLLLVEYYNTSWLHDVGIQIGRTLRVDQTTLNVYRGRYARICVEVISQNP